MAKRVTEEDFLNRIGKDDYTILGEYKNTGTKVKIKHNICDYEWDVYPSNLLSGMSNCPRCCGKERYTTETFKNKIESLVGDEYSLLGEYVHSHTYIEMRHNECGYEWSLLPLSFITRGSRCPRCANRERYTTEFVKEKTIEISNGQFIVLDEYINNYTPMKILHVECGNILDIPFSYILQEMHYCSHCFSCMQSISSGERKIQDYLNMNNIKYEREFSFEDCKYIKSLQFDFAIFGEGDKLICLIEFDGKQHFEPVEWFGGQKGFEKSKTRDGIKNKYCEDNNIPLIRIAYWNQKNIDEILDEKLKVN